MSREIARSALETTGRVQQPLGAPRSMRGAVNQAIRLMSLGRELKRAPLHFSARVRITRARFLPDARFRRLVPYRSRPVRYGPMSSEAQHVFARFIPLGGKPTCMTRRPFEFRNSTAGT